MNDGEIVEKLKKRLNEEGHGWGLQFEVSDVLQPDGAWTKVFIKRNANRKNAAAERQIISGVEEDATETSARELLLVPVPEFNVA